MIFKSISCAVKLHVSVISFKLLFLLVYKFHTNIITRIFIKLDKGHCISLNTKKYYLLFSGQVIKKN